MLILTLLAQNFYRSML